jgi:hypothetical protein
MKNHRTQIKPGQKIDLDLTEPEPNWFLAWYSVSDLPSEEQSPKD